MCAGCGRQLVAAAPENPANRSLRVVSGIERLLVMTGGQARGDLRLQAVFAGVNTHGRCAGAPAISSVRTTENPICTVLMERAGLEPATSGLQSSPRRSGLSRDRRGLAARAGVSSAALRGLPDAVGACRRPRAGCVRDGFVVSLRNNRPETNIGARSRRRGRL